MNLLRLVPVCLCSVALAGGESLAPGDFTYLGRAEIHDVGIAANGLAYRPETGTFFSISRGGLDPFRLFEFQLPDTLDSSEKCTLVKDWGELNPKDILRITGRELVSMRGLLWDAEQGGLWVNYGSFYARSENLPCLAFVKLNRDGTHKTFGPWKVPEKVHSDTVKGMLFEMPADLRSKTGGRQFAAFGARGSTAQGQSWGTGLVSLAKPPLSLPAMSELNCQRLIHWPMRLLPRGFAHSDFPREPEDKATWIIGNMNVGGKETPVSYEYNQFIPMKTYGQMDGLHSCTYVEDSLVYIGAYGIGYCWYGNQGSHNDASAAGVKFKNNLDSLVDPDKKCSSVSIYRGTHVEEYRLKVFILPTAAVVEGVKLGIQTISYKHAADLATLGGTVPLQAAEMTQLYYDSKSKRMYGINNGAWERFPSIHVWQVTR